MTAEPKVSDLSMSLVGTKRPHSEMNAENSHEEKKTNEEIDFTLT